ncbi:Hypothetical protein HEAR0037 [Herminiimonas arsenicoxydans]|uniref:Uncharacterized protein n=1 Tax=Herminiimonas arsenicoxydans TaxID=204773 RepID=A4G186_HERAR|nr:Hypothetical protein HEAR0037 [Herminiimonas arsenicoxydans]
MRHASSDCRHNSISRKHAAHRTPVPYEEKRQHMLAFFIGMQTVLMHRHFRFDNKTMVWEFSYRG